MRSGANYIFDGLFIWLHWVIHLLFFYKFDMENTNRQRKTGIIVSWFSIKEAFPKLRVLPLWIGRYTKHSQHSKRKTFLLYWHCWPYSSEGGLEEEKSCCLTCFMNYRERKKLGSRFHILAIHWKVKQWYIILETNTTSI